MMVTCEGIGWITDGQVWAPLKRGTKYDAVTVPGTSKHWFKISFFFYRLKDWSDRQSKIRTNTVS